MSSLLIFFGLSLLIGMTLSYFLMFFGGLGLLLSKLLSLVLMFFLGVLIFLGQESWWQYVLIGSEILLVFIVLFQTRGIEEADNIDVVSLKKDIVKLSKKVIGRRFIWFYGVVYATFLFYCIIIEPSFLGIQKDVMQSYLPFNIQLHWEEPNFYLYDSWTVRILDFLSLSLLAVCIHYIDKIKEIFNVSLKYIYSHDFIDSSEIVRKIKDIDSTSIIEKILDFFVHHKQLEILKFSSQQYYITYGVSENVINFTDQYARQKNRIKQSVLMDELKKIADLSPDIFKIILLQQNSVHQYFFDTDEYYIHNIYLDNFVFCSSCGIGAELESKYDGEWFCSNQCRQTEKECVEIANIIHKSRQMPTKNDENLEFVARSLSTIEGIGTWIKNYQAINSGESYLSYVRETNNVSAKGHGFASEIMNHENDIFSGKKAQIVGGDNAKNGADRLVDGIKIQTKYYSSARESINAAFDENGFKYLDENGQPMQIEVPKDQYDKAIKIMEKRFEEGKISQVKSIKEAKDLVRQGSVTYNEAKNYAKFCSRESLYFDARNGAIVAGNAMGISFVINVALSYYRNGDIKEAIRQSILVGIKSGGKAFAIFMINAQVQRIPALNSFLQQTINFNFNKGVAKSLASIGKNTKLSSQGINSAANSALRSTVVTAAATIAVTSSFDIISMMCGKISGMQCVKNIAINAGSTIGGSGGALAGAAIGTMIMPGVGTLLGGLIGGFGGSIGGGFLANKLIKIEDDRQRKQRVFFSHLIHLSDLFKLSSQEGDRFKSMVDTYIEERGDFFGSSFPVKNILPYSNSILKPIVVSIVSQRELIPNQVFQDYFINDSLK